MHRMSWGFHAHEANCPPLLCRAVSACNNCSRSSTKRSLRRGRTAKGKKQKQMTGELCLLTILTIQCTEKKEEKMGERERRRRHNNLLNFPTGQKTPSLALHHTKGFVIVLPRVLIPLDVFVRMSL
jgi:hypothetical protein